MSLKSPTQKMSKSAADPRSRILIADSATEINDKLRLALTDSVEGITYDPAARPGVSNLLELLSHFSPISTSANGETEYQSCEELAAEFQNTSMRVFKEHVALTIAKGMEEVRENFRELVETNQGVEFTETVAAQGAADAGWSAGETMEVVRRATGLD